MFSTCKTEVWWWRSDSLRSRVPTIDSFSFSFFSFSEEFFHIPLLPNMHLRFWMPEGRIFVNNNIQMENKKPGGQIHMLTGWWLVNMISENKQYLFHRMHYRYRHGFNRVFFGLEVLLVNLLIFHVFLRCFPFYLNIKCKVSNACWSLFGRNIFFKLHVHK